MVVVVVHRQSGVFQRRQGLIERLGYLLQRRRPSSPPSDRAPLLLRAAHPRTPKVGPMEGGQPLTGSVRDRRVRPERLAEKRPLDGFGEQSPRLGPVGDGPGNREAPGESTPTKGGERCHDELTTIVR